MHALLQHFLCRSEEATCQHDDRCRPITGLDVLSCRQIHELFEVLDLNSTLLLRDLYHFCSRMQSLDTFQNSRAVIRDDEFALGCLDLENMALARLQA